KDIRRNMDVLFLCANFWSSISRRPYFRRLSAAKSRFIGTQRSDSEKSELRLRLEIQSIGIAADHKKRRFSNESAFLRYIPVSPSQPHQPFLPLSS
ncbi:hypothetical protein, partial [Geofilum rubicundum]|uniref:hypothetical protein n=1 Tax=Geofilum rubicundum TaxID=472113 RepID=UPI001D0DDA73